MNLKFVIVALIIAYSTAQANPNVNQIITGITVRPVAPLTGPDAISSTRSVDICGTDIGTMTELDGRIYFAFGDTFGYDGENCPKFGPNWRSNTLGVSSDLDPSDGVVWDWWLTGRDGKATAITEGAHQPAFTGENGEQTRIPTAMVAVNEHLYLHYMSIHGFAPRGGEWTCNYSTFVYSDDLGESWHESAERIGDRDANFNMLALTAERGAGNEAGAHVYALGTPCGRYGGVKVARFPKDEILNPVAWEYVTALTAAEHPVWSRERADAIEVIPAPAGEASLLWNPHLDRWMYTYLNEDTASLELREAQYPWGPWSAPHTLVTARDFPQLYGAFMTPSYLQNNGRTLYFIMSLFGPYNTFLMEATLEW